MVYLSSQATLPSLWKSGPISHYHHHHRHRLWFRIIVIVKGLFFSALSPNHNFPPSPLP